MDYKLIDKYIQDVLDKSKPSMPYWNLESIRLGKKPHWNYIDGCMIAGLLSLYYFTKEQRYLDFADSFVDYYIDDDGKVLGFDIQKYNIDDISEGRVLFDLYALTKKPKYRKAMDTLYAQILTQPRTKEGNFWHKAIYPHQVWLDGLYMGQVFYTRYETEFNDKKGYDDIVSQFKNVKKIMFDDKKGLYYHGYDSEKKMFWADERGLSKNFWLRAIGWYSVALIDVIDYMQSVNHKNELTKILVDTLNGIAKYIDKESGMLWQVVDMIKREGNYPETSGSSMIAYTMLKAARLGLVSSEFEKIGLDLFDSIVKRYLTEDENGINLGGICLVAGLGPSDNLRRDGSFEYYISEPIVNNDAKGLGPFLMAYTEVIKVTS